MGFWIFMMAMDLMIPGMMIGFGWLFLNRPPKTINHIFGYRTVMSMKNKDTWEFAHRFCGRLWYRLGFILLPVSVILMLVVTGRDADTIGTLGGIVCLIQLVPLIGSVIHTEMMLKKTFDQNGNRR